MPKFMMTLSSKPEHWKNLSPEEARTKFASYQVWGEELRAKGIYVAGEKLAEDAGKQLRLQNGRVSVIDGPFSETKEVLGGFLILRAASYDEAVALVRESPFVNDYTIDLRQTDPIGCGGA
jgi:hypothetical protein